MKKRIVLILVIVMVLAPIMASSFSFDEVLNEDKGFSVGIFAGSPTGIVAQYTVDDWDFYALLGTNYYAFSGTFGAQKKLTNFDIEDLTFGVNAGLEVPLSISSYQFEVGAAATVSVDYEFDDIPLILYIRTGVGINIINSSYITSHTSVKPMFVGGIGANYKLY